VHGVIELRDDAERAAAAGEYVLGTLAADDQAAFETALAQDPGLRALVYAWQDRLLSLSAEAAPVEPGPQLWPRIDSALGAPAAAAGVIPAAGRAVTPPSPRQRSGGAPRLPWWQRVRLWQGVSALAVAASLFMAVLLVERSALREPAGARYLAVLQSPDKQATGWVVEVQTGRSVRLVPVAEGARVPAGRSLQFWTKPQGAAGPTSLGLVRAGQTLELPVSRLPAVGPQQLFEITLEPEGGSPIDRPTGPILFVGSTVAI
jgi:anti-sigma-K factor RskA